MLAIHSASEVMPSWNQGALTRGPLMVTVMTPKLAPAGTCSRYHTTWGSAVAIRTAGGWMALYLAPALGVLVAVGMLVVAQMPRRLRGVRA